MRLKLASLGIGLLATVLTVAAAAQADDEFDVAVSKGTITVTPKGAWHINKDYPWKLVQGTSKIDKSKFSLDDKKATLSNAPAGAGKLKGAVCSGDQCKTFEKDVNVP